MSWITSCHTPYMDFLSKDWKPPPCYLIALEKNTQEYHLYQSSHEVKHGFESCGSTFPRLPSCARWAFPLVQIDMMISIADADGDGQVSYEDFHRVVIDPDPSRHDFGTDITKTQPKEAGTAPTQVTSHTRTSHSHASMVVLHRDRT